MIGKARKALLLRVGMDRGTGGGLGPIFRDATFEYVPIPEQESTLDRRTYATLQGRHGRPLADYLPRRLSTVHPHVDPDFETATYGDAAPRKRRQLAKLAPGDILIFYCGLAPCPSNDAPRLFAIGYLYVKQIHALTANDIKKEACAEGLVERLTSFAKCSRAVRPGTSCLAERSPLGDSSDNLLRDLEGLAYQGSIQRAVGHWVRGEAALESLQDWIKEGPRMLVGPRSRLFRLAQSSPVHPKDERKSDVAIVVGTHPIEVEDWFLVSSGISVEVATGGHSSGSSRFVF